MVQRGEGGRERGLFSEQSGPDSASPPYGHKDFGLLGTWFLHL